MALDSDAHGAIRLARAEDAAGIAALVEAAYVPWIEVIGRRPRPMDDDYQARCDKGQAWLLEVGATPVGVVIVEEIDGALFLHNVAVSPGSQRAGHGRSLLRFVEAEALRRGLREVWLTTSSAMQRNAELYQSIGYVVTGREPTATADRLLMSKRVG